jgi:hypothetical protein
MGWIVAGEEIGKAGKCCKHCGELVKEGQKAYHTEEPGAYVHAVCAWKKEEERQERIRRK